MIAFAIEIRPDAPIGVMALDAWEEHGPDAYDPRQDEFDNHALVAPGSVSHATMRFEDLIPTFMFLLEQVDRETATEITSRYSGDGWPSSMAGLAFGDPFEGEQITLQTYLMEDLFDALSNLAPPGYYFGSHPGDGSDYGFWQVEEDYLQDLDEGPILVHNDEDMSIMSDELQDRIDTTVGRWAEDAHRWLANRIYAETGLTEPQDGSTSDEWQNALEGLMDRLLGREA
jgi:hypothetical protein